MPASDSVVKFPVKPQPAKAPLYRVGETHQSALRAIEYVLDFERTDEPAVHMIERVAALHTRVTATVAESRRHVALAKAIAADTLRIVSEIRVIAQEMSVVKRRIIGRVQRFGAADVAMTDLFTESLERAHDEEGHREGA